MDFRRNAGLLAILLAGCSGLQGALPPAIPAGGGAPLPGVSLRTASSKYIYVSDRTAEKLFVYPAHEPHPQPLRVLGAHQGIVELGGIAVDSTGDLYVANGSAGNVLEFTAGASALVRKYRRLLSHPVNVAIGPQDTLYVIDNNDNYSTGATSSVVEYTRDDPVPSMLLLDPSPDYYPLHGITVDSHGSVYVTANPARDYWPLDLSICTAPAATEIFDFILPTLILPISLKSNAQALGLAFNGATLYASDPCRNAVQMYVKGTWQHLNPVPYSFDKPVYETISSDGLLTIPCAADARHGYVAVINLRNGERSTITGGLRGPIAAAAGP